MLGFENEEISFYDKISNWICIAAIIMVMALWGTFSWSKDFTRNRLLLEHSQEQFGATSAYIDYLSMEMSELQNGKDYQSMPHDEKFQKWIELKNRREVYIKQLLFWQDNIDKQSRIVRLDEIKTSMMHKRIFNIKNRLYSAFSFN